MAKKNEVVKSEKSVEVQVGGAISAERRAKYAGAGLETMDSEDLRPPRLKLAQALTPELRDIDELKPGLFFNNITMETFESMRIIAIKHFRTFILFGPRESGDGVLARATDGINWEPADLEYQHPSLANVVWKTAPTVKGSGLNKFGTSNPADPQSPPAATKFLNYLCFNADDMEAGPFILSFSRSGIVGGESFLTQLRYSGGIAWNNIYQLNAKEVRNNKGDFFVPVTRSVGKTDTLLWDACADIHDSFENKNVIVDDDAEDETASKAADDDEIPF